MTPIPLVKAHGFGNDFLLVDERALAPSIDRPSFARAVCERHRGIGADGLVIYREDAAAGSATFDLLNADGSHSELSGNGVRCLAAWLIGRGGETTPARQSIDIITEAGAKRLELLRREGGRVTFRASMGHPTDIAQCSLEVRGRPLNVVTLRVGNPQCVVLGDVTEERLHSLASALAVHPHFPEGTNVELATVEAPDRVRILIWERGVGPTEASGTGACAAAVAAMQYGGASRDVEVSAPGGTQRVEWTDDGLFLTGWAEVVAEARWLRETERE
jgi:diaminopimelate epimerase